LCEKGRKKRKIDLPLLAGERGEKEKKIWCQLILVFQA